MIAKWDADGLLGPNGRFYNFRPEDPVGTAEGQNTEVKAESERAGINEHVTVVKEDDQSYTVVIKGMSEKQGKAVIMSSRDITGSVQTRFADQRGADEIFTFVEPAPRDAWKPAFVLWCVHTRHNADGVLMTFAPTLFTVANPRKV